MEYLDRLVLEGKAENKTMTCYGAQYFALDIPFQQTIVITQIEWTPFINFPYNPDRSLSLQEVQNYTQYQLKISDDKGANFIHFNNSSCVFNNINPSDNYDMNVEVGKWVDNMIFQNGAMVVIPCFFPIQQQLRMTVQRTYPNYIQVEESALIGISKEPNIPDGIKDLTQSVYLHDFATNSLNYQPGIVSPVPDFFVGNKYNGYYWGSTNSDELQPVDMYPNNLRCFTQPLFTIHYTLIKENLIQEID